MIDEHPIRAGDRFAAKVGTDVLDRDGGARHDAAARIGYDAGNLPGKALRVCARGRAGDKHRQRKRRSPKTMAHVPLLLISVR